MRTAVARPIALDVFTGSGGVISSNDQGCSTPLVVDLDTRSDGEQLLITDPFVPPAGFDRDPAHLDTPFTNAAHHPPSLDTLSPPPSPIAWDGD